MFFKRKPKQQNNDTMDMTRIPKHIGIIMDGNGRWAKSKGLPRKAGHRQGAKTIENITDYCASIGVEVITAYAFSTENWNRPKEEVDALMDLLYEYLIQVEEKFKNDNRIKYIYDKMSPLQARFILGNGKLTITGRMHGAINTLQMRKPAISISYSVKYDGVIGKDLGLSELIVKGDNSELWTNKRVSNDTIEKIDFILSNYSDIANKIDNSVKESEKNIISMIKDIANNIKGDK